MTGHDDRTIMSTTPAMMTRRTGSSDIMSTRSDLRIRANRSVLDMMSRSTARHMIRPRDLRERGSCPGSVTTPDIMSNLTTIVTACSDRSNR